MPPRLIVLFNHTLTNAQRADARQSLGADEILEPPPAVKRLWAEIPPEIEGLDEYLAPVSAWLTGSAVPGDYVLIQGDFGATCLLVRFTVEMGLKPVYSTTRREATETLQPDGTVELTHRFGHVRFRRYGL